jgi:uracil-DNA glycosylase
VKPAAAVMDELPLAKTVTEVPTGSLASLRATASSCRACPLWKYATQTVFGSGPARAVAMLIGEQPGAQEDLDGRPFVGPAGKLLRQALDQAGVSPRSVYLTNTVKHFKYEQRGKQRLHKRANASEQEACRPWLAAELLRVRPALILALGAMAAQTVFGNGFKLTRQRGIWKTLPREIDAMATWHPSAILRMRDPDREKARNEFFADIESLAKAIDRLSRPR